jgi:hypothetical protein
MLIKNQKKLLLIVLFVLLVAGFLVTNLLGFAISISFLRNQISSSSLPLTSDNIYSEIQRDIIKPVYISSVMAHNSYIRDWVLDGEADVDRISRYLQEIKRTYDTLTAFFVSEKTRNYYYPDGVLKQVSENKERDIWYFRVREMQDDYELNIDPDMANEDAMTIFINHRVYDYDGNYIGTTGVGLAIHSVSSVVSRYRERFDSNIYFLSQDGRILLRSNDGKDASGYIADEPGFSDIADKILANHEYSSSYTVGGRRIFVNSRFIPELNWYLLVAQHESGTVAHTYKTLFINLAVCAMIVLIVVGLSTLVLNAYQRIMQQQQDELVAGHQQLELRNKELDAALKDVKRLSGLLPICAACKKIRDDKGYWQKIEMYIQEHSDASFTHGICPDCEKRLYPDEDE